MKFLAAGVIGFLATTIWSRFVNEKAMAALSNEQKGLLISRFSSARKYSVLALSAIILLFLLMAYYGNFDKMTGMYLYFGTFMVYTVVVTFMGLSAARKMDLPAEYLKPAQLAGILRLVGLVILMVCMVLFLREYAGESEIHF